MKENFKKSETMSCVTQTVHNVKHPDDKNNVKHPDDCRPMNFSTKFNFLLSSITG